MNLFTSTPEREVIATVQFLPAVSIIMPFTPVITLKKNLEYSLKNVMAKVEAMLTKHYTVEKAIPVIIKLRKLISGLNYSSSKKSVAIFVSPVVEEVYYLGVEMEEKIVIDPSFKIGELVGCKKKKKEYLILLLNDTSSKMYLGSDTQLQLIKANSIFSLQDNKNDIIEKIADGSVDADQLEHVTKKFLLKMDQGLSIILKSYPLPVFVMGREKVLKHFKKITANDENLAQFIHGNYEGFSEVGLSGVMEHLVSRWEKLKQQHLLKQIEKAKTQNKLTTGIEETLKATAANKGKLLVVEKKYMHNLPVTKTYKPFFKTDTSFNELFFIKDEVDDIIKNVFESGGDVEFIDDELLKDYRHIALIERD